MSHFPALSNRSATQRWVAAATLALVMASGSVTTATTVPASNEASTGKPADGSDDLGKIGPTWPIAEPDLLEQLLVKVRQKQDDGEAAKLEDQLHQRAQAYIDTPPSLHLARASHNAARNFDPTLVLPYDIKDAKGNVLFAAGTRVNPLEHRSFDETLLLVDGDDAEQIDWLKRRLATDHDHSLRDKIVLTGGSPGKLGEQLKRTVYFDQDGKLIGKFSIDAVPASVEADPDAPRERLLIRSYDPLEKIP